MNNGETDNRSDMSADELNKQVKLAELDKLKAETTSIARPLFQPSTWIPILIGVGGIIAAMAQWQVSSIKQEKAALEAERRTFEAKKGTRSETTRSERALPKA